MTDLNPEDRALIERAAGGTLGETIKGGTSLEWSLLAKIIDAARTEGRRSGEDGDAWEALKHRCASTKPGTPGWDEVTTLVQVRREDVEAVFAPPVEAKPAEGVREAVARIIDHEGYWERLDGCNHALSTVQMSEDSRRALTAVRDDELRATAESLAKADAILALIPAHPATGTDELPADVVRLVRAAYLAGAQAVHDAWSIDPFPEFEEAADDYAASVSRVPMSEGEGR